jgi:hypothetical protein
MEAELIQSSRSLPSFAMEWMSFQIVFALAVTLLVLFVARKSMFFIGKDEQLRFQTMTDILVHNGPLVMFQMPFTYRSVQVVKAINLGKLDYVKIKNTDTGDERIVTGPKPLFLGGYEEIASKGQGVSLDKTEYILISDKSSGGLRVQTGPCLWFPSPDEVGQKASCVKLSSTEYIWVTDTRNGEQRMVKGPKLWFPGEGHHPGQEHPYESASGVKSAIALQDDEYMKLKDMATGERWVQQGKDLVFLKPTWNIEGVSSRSGVRKAWILKKYEYVRLIDNTTGTVRIARGEAKVFPGPDEELLDEDKMTALDLKVNEYVKVLDQSTGNIRVVTGQKASEPVILGAHDKYLDGGRHKAIEVDDDHAVLVRNKQTGQLRLVTERQLFFPGEHDAIENVQELIKLADHEAMILKDAEGKFHYKYGSKAQKAARRGVDDVVVCDEISDEGDGPCSFFLPPYHSIVQLCWSRGRRREKRDLYINRFDCRAQYMSFEFNCRTKDNVELVLEGTFFWEVVDLPLMVQKTGDASGDLCNHARSQFIKQVAQVTLQEFMDDLNRISNAVYKEDAPFYESRGVKVHSLEVTSYSCAQASTSEVLQQIIAETTNRMNRLSQAESENEVNKKRIEGMTAQEELNGKLLEIQQIHAQEEAKVQGIAEANKVVQFLKTLEDGGVPNLSDRIDMWRTLRKTDALSAVSQGGATLYYTPNDVNLSIETKTRYEPA